MSIFLQTVKVEGAVENPQVLQLDIFHAPNEYAVASLSLSTDVEKAKKFLSQPSTDPIKISAKDGDDDVVLFCGYLVNASFEVRADGNRLILDLCDTAYLLDRQRMKKTFQKLNDKYADILKTQVPNDQGTINLKVTDKEITKMIVQFNETPWQFIKRMASQFSASVFTDLTAPKPLVTIGLPDEKAAVELKGGAVAYEYDDAQFNFLQANSSLLSKDVQIAAEDFSVVNLSGGFPWLSLGSKVTWNEKEYYIKKIDAQFINNMLRTNYTLVSKNAFVVPIESFEKLRGRIFYAQVKKVEKDKIQAHLFNIDKDYDTNSTTWFPFATPYSSADGSGWYVMPEVDDYVRIIFPSSEAGDAFASSSINSAPLKEPHNKSLKAPGGRELLITDTAVEIIAEHQKTFIKLDMDKGISVVSAKDITIYADGNISFQSTNGSIQLLAKKSITSQVGESHIKMDKDQINMGSGSVIIGK